MVLGCGGSKVVELCSCVVFFFSDFEETSLLIAIGTSVPFATENNGPKFIPNDFLNGSMSIAQISGFGCCEIFPLFCFLTEQQHLTAVRLEISVVSRIR